MANEMANLNFQNLANKAERKYPKKVRQVFCYFGKSNFQIGKKHAKKMSLEMTLESSAAAE